MVQLNGMKVPQKEKIRELRSKGKTYSEINKILNFDTPKSTMSCICKDVLLPKHYITRVKQINCKNLEIARKNMTANRELKRKRLTAEFYRKNKNLKQFLKNKKSAKIFLACLYLAEGGKTRRGSLMFGNSDPRIIRLFLSLLRRAYVVDESRLRCTLQCRADQNIKSLQRFWSRVAGVPIGRFFKPQVDKRSLGKKTIKTDYKGVCRIDYFSANVFHELMMIGKIITE